MLENKHNLTVDTQNKSIGNAFIEVVQNDNVALEVQIYNNNLLVDNTAYTYTLLSVLPSKERIIRQGSIGPNGYPVFNLGIEEMSETGIILAMVQVYDELGNRVTSYDFKYRMKEDLSTGGVVPSADNPKFVIITEDSLNQTVQDAQLSRQELDEMKTDADGVAHLTPNDRLVSDYNKINTELNDVNADKNNIKDRSFLKNLLGVQTNFDDTKNYLMINDTFPSAWSNVDTKIGGRNLFSISKSLTDTSLVWRDGGAIYEKGSVCSNFMRVSKMESLKCNYVMNQILFYVYRDLFKWHT